MKFFGTGSSEAKMQKVGQVKCPNCGMQDQVNIQGIAKRFYVFWIPVIPLNKEFYVLCRHCKGVYNKYNMNKEEYREIDQVIRRRSNTVRKYRPVFILGLVLLLTFLFVQFA